MENKLIIIGPIGIRKKTIELMSFTHSDGNKHKYDKIEEKYNTQFIELLNEEQYKTETFKITALSLKHGQCVPINGYILEKTIKYYHMHVIQVFVIIIIKCVANQIICFLM